ncbi:serum/glucocorticoid-regulated kinase 2 [Nematocida displodere]|uniref:Serum/glucocorticoid-regulated kinase 2 n=1 Tax=Nematocida displodere TaxID=1805483 RepID=A0A177EIT8_9MICR|nr:serum/glucocorticoid-regulated kinase 2 [Nematocida displodere]
MDLIKKVVRRLFYPKKKPSVPTVVIGAVTVTLTRTVCSQEVHIEFRGHAATLSAQNPRTFFDVFEHGTLYIRVGRKREKIKTATMAASEALACGGAAFTLEFSARKKKLGLEDFQFLRLIGKGTFGKVILVKHIRTERLYACKIIKKTVSHDSIEKMVNEKNILSQIHSPFLIHLLASFQTEDKVFLILPYIEGGELFHHLEEHKAFSEDVARFYFCELLLAVAYLHQNKIIYRDIKPENVLLDKTGHIVLCDFGMSTQSALATTYCGTPEYIAPEIIRNEAYDESVDYYTLGVLLYEMVCGSPPFFLLEGEDAGDLENRILFSAIEYPQALSAEIKSLLALLMHRVPARRPRPEQIKKHAFFGGIDWDRVQRREYLPEILPPAPELKEGAIPTDSMDTPYDTYQGILPGFTYCQEDWDANDPE